MSAEEDLARLQQTPSDRTRVAEDVTPEWLQRRLSKLEWQFLKGSIPYIGRNVDRPKIKRQIGNTLDWHDRISENE